MTNSGAANNKPFFTISDNNITEVSDSLGALVGFSKEDMLGTGIAEVLALLRVQRDACEKLDNDGSADCFLFTKALEPREVTISVMRHGEGKEQCYTFEEKPNSRLEDKIVFVNHVFLDNKIGAAIYSAPDLVLLKANQRYIDDATAPFNRAADCIGRALSELIPGYPGSKAEDAWQKVLETAQEQQVREYKTKNAEGGDTYWDATQTPIFENGRMKYIYKTHEEVTQRVVAKQKNLEQENKIRLQKEKIESIIVSMPDPMVIFNRDGSINTMNQAALDLLVTVDMPLKKIGDVRQVIGFFDANNHLIAPEDVPPSRILRGETLVDFRMRVKFGQELYYVDISGNPIYDKDGNILLAVLCFRNVTALVNAEEQYGFLFESMQSGIVHQRADGGLIMMNPAAEAILGRTPEKFVGSCAEKDQQQTINKDGVFFPEEENPTLLALRTGQPIYDVIMGVYNPTLEVYRWITLNAVPLFCPSETKPYQVLTVFSDITEKKNAEDALAKSEACLRAVLDNSGDVIYSMNLETSRYEYVSASNEKVFGYTAAEFTELDREATHAMIHPADRAAFVSALPQVDARIPQEFRYRQRTKNGEYRWVSNRLVAINGGDGQPLYFNGHIHDITDEVKNQEITQYQANLLKNISDIIISTDENLLIKSWNSAAELTYGWTEEEVIGKNIDELFQTVVFTGSFEQEMRELFESSKIKSDRLHTCKDGRKILAHCDIQTLKNENGQIIGYLGFVQDVTEHKKKEDTIAKQNLILRTINEIYDKAFQYDSIQELGQVYLKLIEFVTGSKLGFIDEYGSDYFLQDATTNTVTKKEKMLGKQGPHWAADGFKLHGLYNSALEAGKDFIMNNPTLDPADINVPEGHPELTAFLCVPYIRDEKALGMIGVGNREGGYGQEEQALLEAITPTIIEVLLRKRMELELKEAVEVAETKTLHLNAILDNLTEGVIVTDVEGKFLYVNPSVVKRTSLSEPESHAHYRDFTMKLDVVGLDGRPVPLEERPLCRVLRGEHFKDVEVWVGRQDSEAKWIGSHNGTPVYNDQGEMIMAILTMSDVTEKKKTELELKHHQELLEAVIENMHDAVGVFDRNQIMVLMNARARMDFPHFGAHTTVKNGYEGYRCFDLERHLLPVEQLPSMRVFSGEVIRNERVVIEYPGKTRYVEVNATPIYKDRELDFVVINHHDITDMMQKQQEILKKNAMLDRQSKLLDQSNEAIFTWELSGAIIYWNDGAEKLYGYNRREALGRNSHELLKTKYLGMQEDIDSILEKDKLWSGVIEQTAKDGTLLMSESFHQVFKDESGRQLVLETNRDITARLKMETALRESEARLRSILENSNDLIFSFNLQTEQYVYISPASEKVFGYSPEELIAMGQAGIHKMIHPDDHVVHVAALKKLEEKNATEIHYRQRTKSGEYRWVSNRLANVRDENGRPLYRNGIIHDITEQVENDAVIRYQANLLQNISDIIISTDENLIIKSWNKTAERTYGWTEEEAIGQNARTLLQSEDSTLPIDETVNRLLEQNRIIAEETHTRRDGRKLNVVGAVELLKNSGGDVIGAVAIIHDITEQKKMEIELRESEARLRAVLENSNDLIYSFDLQTEQYVYISPASEKVFGYSPEELTAMGQVGIHKMIHPEDHAAYVSVLEDLEEKNATELHYRQRTKSGEYRWVSNRLANVRDENGRPLYRNGIIHDITEQVENDAVIRYQADLLQNISDIVISTDVALNIKSWNKAAECTYGWSEEEALGKNVLKLLEAEGMDTDTEKMLEFLREYGKVEVENVHKTKDGKKIIALNTIEVIKNSDGEIIGTVGIFRDVTERKKSVDALRESEVRLRAVLENSNDIIYSQNIQTNRYEYVSPASKTVLGYTPEEFMAIDDETTCEMIHPDDRSAFLSSFTALDVKGVQELNYRQRTKSGDYRWYSNRLSVVRDDAGRVLYRFGNIHDITEQVEKDAVIRYQANLLQNISDMIISTDAEHNIKSWNKAAERTYGWTEAEVLGKNIREIMEAEAIDTAFEERHDRLKVEGKVEFENIYTSKDGKKIYARNTLELIKDSDGRFIGTVGVFRNVTEQKEMEEALRESEMNLRLAAEGAGLGTYSLDFITGKTFWSAELKALWGLKPTDAVQLDENMLYVGLHPEDKQEFLSKVEAANKPNSDGVFDVDYRAVQPDGTIKWLHVRGLTVFAGTGENRHPVSAAGAVIDISKRVEAENSVREISRELRNIMESTDDYIYSVDSNYRLIFFNTAFSNYVERNLGQQLRKGMLLLNTLPMLNNSDLKDFFQQVAKEGKAQLEINVENGRVMALSFNPIYIDAQLEEITVFCRDITQRISSEREIIRLNTSLERSVVERTDALQKTVASLQNLSRIISHDLKGHVREIENYARHSDREADCEENALKIRKACQSMSHMIEGLSKYAVSSDKEIQKETVNVKRIMTSIYNELKTTATNCTILQFESGLPLVCADKVLLQQALYNILSNAMKYSSKRDIAEITIGCVEENDTYVFYIKDNGVGFDMQYAHKLFNAFERLHTNEEFEGTGIGLAAVRNIIQRHGGRTWIESQEQVGTAVYFTLPIDVQVP